MDRNATAAILVELGAAQNRPVHLVEVMLDSGTIYLTDAYKHVAFGGNTYLSRGDLLGFDGLEETAELRNNEITGTLMGCDQLGPIWVSLAQSEGWLNRRLILRKAFLNENGDSISLPLVIFDGLMDEPTITDDPAAGNCSVTLRANSQLSDFFRQPGRRSNNNGQQLFFPGDLFFEFTSEQNKTIVWGGDRLIPAPFTDAGPSVSSIDRVADQD